MEFYEFFTAADLPAGKAVLMSLLVSILAVSCTVAAVLPHAKLQRYSDAIGTDNPYIARGVCVAGAAVGWVFVAAMICFWAGILD